MGNCTNNTSNINKTFIIESTSPSSGNTYVVSGSFSGDTLTLLRNDAVSIDINGFTDYFVTGSTFNNSTDTLLLFRNDGQVLEVSGITDTFTTGVTLDNGSILYFHRNDALSAYTVDLSGLVTTGTTGDTRIIPLIYETESGSTTSVIPAFGGSYAVSSQYTSILGGRLNSATLSNHALIGSGVRNVLNGADNGIIIGGYENKINFSLGSSIFSGNKNLIYLGASNMIVSGESNYINNSVNSLILFGSGNTINSANFSSIIGGSASTVTHDNSHVIGSTISSVSANTTHVNNLNIYNTPVSSTSLTQILVRDSNGMIRVRDYSSFDSANDTFISGTSFDSNTYILSIDRNDGVSFTENLSALASDVYVLSGVYVPETGVVTYTNSTGGTFQVSGFTTGMTDSYTTSASLSGESITFDNNIQGANLYNVSLTPLLSGKTDISLFNSHTADTSVHHTLSELDDRYVNVTGDTMTGPLTINSTLNVTGDTTLANTTGDTIQINDFLEFNTGYTGNTIVEGRMYWDDENGTVSLGLHSNEVSLQIGQETHYHIVNQSGATIQNGRVVRAAGTLGASGKILGEYMIADGSIPQKYTLGVATHDILNGQEGYVTEFGLVRSIDTTGAPYGETWNDGDILWVHPTIAGGLTKNQPMPPHLKIEVAIVIDAAANGSIFVRPHRYPHVHDLQEVTYSANTEQNLQILQWSEALSGFTLTSTPQLDSVSATSITATTFYGDGSNLTGIASSDTYITGSTITGDTTQILTNNTGGTVTQELEIERELSFRAEEFALNTAARVTLTPLVLSAVRFAGNGAVDDAGISFIIPSDYKSGGELSFTYRTSSSNSSLNGFINFDIYTGDTGNTGTLLTSTETVTITGSPETTANVFVFSDTATPTTQFAPNMQIHSRVYRDPSAIGDDNFDLDLINLIFRYNAKR